MKRTLLFFAFALILTVGGNAQGFDSLWGKVKDKISGSNNESDSKTGDVLSGILGAVTGGKKLTYGNLCGTWNYEGVSCSLESEQALAEIGSKLATAKVEEKINELLLKVGMEKGKASVVFEKDSVCNVLVNGKSRFSTTYAIGEDAKSIAFTFLYGRLTLHSTVEYVGDEMSITFDADRVLNVIKSLSSALSQYGSKNEAASESVSSTMALVKTLSVMLEGYNGMRLGFRVSK